MSDINENFEQVPDDEPTKGPQVNGTGQQNNSQSHQGDDGGQSAGWNETLIAERTFKIGPPFPKRRQLVYGNFAARKRVTVIGGTSGIGKTAMISALSADMASAGALTKTPCPEGHLKVASINAEDDTEEVDRSLNATCVGNDITKVHIGDRIVAIGRDKLLTAPVAVAGSERAPNLNTSFFKSLSDLIETSDSDVLIIDPIAGLTGAVEFTPGVMNLLLRAFIDIAIRHNIAIIVVAHTRKKQGINSNNDEAEDLSGGKTQQNAARCVIMARPMTEKEATAFHLDKDEMRKLVRATVRKTNIGIEGATLWWEKQTTMLTDDDGEYEMNYVSPWSPPFVSENADTRIWSELKARLQSDFIYGSLRSNAEPRIDNVIQEIANTAGLPMDAKKVAEAMIKSKWIEIEDHKPEGKKSSVKRAVVGSGDPDHQTQNQPDDEAADHGQEFTE